MISMEFNRVDYELTNANTLSKNFHFFYGLKLFKLTRAAYLSINAW